MEKKHKSIRGITLVALVVTIIVLLILAGLTINIVLVDDGIFKKAEQALEVQRKTEVEEKLSTILTEALVKKIAYKTEPFEYLSGEVGKTIENVYEGSITSSPG